MSKIYSFTLLIFLFIFISACKKGGDKETSIIPDAPTEGNLLNSNTYIIPDDAFSDLTDNSITIIHAKTALRPKVGDVLLAQPSTNAPYGFMRKVIITSAPSSGTTECNIEQAGLNEAFKQLNIDTSFVDSFFSNTNYRKIATVNYANNDDLIPGVKINGTLQINLDAVKFKYLKKADSFLPQEVIILSTLNTKGSGLEFSVADNIAIHFEEGTLQTIYLPTIRVPIPIPIPILPYFIMLPVPFTQKLELKWKPLTISGKMKISWQPVLTATLGVKYENGSWNNLSNLSFSGSADSLYKNFFPSDIGLNAEFTYINPVYSLSPYNSDALSFKVSIPNSLDLTIQPPAFKPNYSLKYQAKIAGSVISKLWLGKNNEYSIGHNLPDQTLKEGNWEDDECDKGLIKAPIITNVQFECNSANEISVLISFTANGSGVLIGDGFAVCDENDMCYPTRLYFFSPGSNGFTIASNSYKVALKSGTVNEGVLELNLRGGFNYCLPDKGPKESLEYWYPGYQWKVELMNKCNQRSSQVSF